MDSINDNKYENENFVVKHSVKYVLYAAFIFGVINLLDIFSSNATPLLQSYIVQEFFVDNGIAENIGYARLNAVQFIGFPLILLALSMKFITDRFGRKPGLIISLIGMSIGALLIAFSQNFVMYVIGNLMGGIFLSTDVQLLTIQEEAPIEKRARYLAFARVVGLIGAMLVPLSRELFLSDRLFPEPNWRAVFYFPVGLGIILTIVAIFTMKESSVYLTMKNQKEHHDAEKPKLGFIESMRIARKNPHFRIIIIISIAALLGMIGGMPARAYMEPTLNLTFNNTQVNTIYYIRYGISIVLGLFMGIIRDKIGRKIGLIITLSIQVTFFILFLIFKSQGWVLLTGLTYGLYIYALWMHTYTSGLIVNELTPTEVRGTMSIYIGLFSFGFMALGQILTIVLILLPGFTFDVILAICTIPFAILGIYLTVKYAPETKGTDLTTLTT
ncbi:MAG: MFS transporter [Promethearchaeota archaeon]